MINVSFDYFSKKVINIRA